MRPSLLLFAVLYGSTLSAQAPRITANGDPSVRDDSIYNLVVKPEDYPNEDFIYLLDDGVIRHEADGTSSTTYRQVIQLLTKEAVETWAEQSFSWTPGRERLTVNWIRVLGLDGRVISDKPSQVQDSDIPAEFSNPVYADRKVRRMSLSNVAPGTLIDYSVTTEELKPFLPGDFLHSWSVTTAHFTRRSRYLLDVPATMPVHIVETNLNFPVQVRQARGRTVRVWATQDVKPVQPEPFMADSNGLYMSIGISGTTSWQDIARWYAGLARDRYQLSPELETQLSEVVKEARTRDDSLRAVHRWVAQDFRYVSVSLGIGGYQPRTPAEVLSTKYGDCKDKATLFIALVQRMGYTAFPVLLAAGGNVDSTLPSLSQFDHAIAAIQKPDGYLYVDLTSELTPLGQVPEGDQGEFALLVHPDGRGEPVRLPLNAPLQNVHRTELVGEMDSTGLVTAHYEESGEGTSEASLRESFAAPFDSTQRANFIHAMAAQIFPGSSGDSLELFDGKDFAAPARVALMIRGGQAAKVTGSRAIFTIPFGNMGRLIDVVNELEARGPRRSPIDVARVIGPTAAISEMRLTLPEGWHAELPERVEVMGAYGSYTSEYQQNGRELVIRRRLIGARGIRPPEAVAELVAWLKAASRDNAQYLILGR